MTLSDYRTTVRLERADRILRGDKASVKRAARHAGYTTASSFIVAYKRLHGVRPGEILRRDRERRLRF
jgi:AraC-like DNA-binding protein